MYRRTAARSVGWLAGMALAFFAISNANYCQAAVAPLNAPLMFTVSDSQSNVSSFVILAPQSPDAYSVESGLIGQGFVEYKSASSVTLNGSPVDISDPGSFDFTVTEYSKAKFGVTQGGVSLKIGSYSLLFGDNLYLQASDFPDPDYRPEPAVAFELGTHDRVFSDNDTEVTITDLSASPPPGAPGPRVGFGLLPSMACMIGLLLTRIRRSERTST